MLLFYNPTHIVAKVCAYIRKTQAAKVETKALKRSKVLSGKVQAVDLPLCAVRRPLDLGKPFAWILLLGSRTCVRVELGGHGAGG